MGAIIHKAAELRYSGRASQTFVAGSTAVVEWDSAAVDTHGIHNQFSSTSLFVYNFKYLEVSAYLLFTPSASTLVQAYINNTLGAVQYAQAVPQAVSMIPLNISPVVTDVGFNLTQLSLHVLPAGADITSSVIAINIRAWN